MISSATKRQIINIKGLDVLKPIDVDISFEGNEYRAHAPEIPFVNGAGRTEDEAVEELKHCIFRTYNDISSSNADFYSVEEWAAILIHVREIQN